MIEPVDHKSNHSKMNTLKLLLWLACGSITMTFAAFSSAYIVQKSSAVWQVVEIPYGFIINMVTVIVLSFTMHMAFKSMKSEKGGQFMLFLKLSFLFMFSFIALQFYAYNELLSNNIALFNMHSQAGPFLYVISGVHAAHVLLGLGFMIALYFLYKRQGVTEMNALRSELCATYLHFMGGVWIFLCLFFVINH